MATPRLQNNIDTAQYEGKIYRKVPNKCAGRVGTKRTLRPVLISMKFGIRTAEYLS